MDEVMYCEKCGDVGHIFFSKKCKQCNIKKKMLPENTKYKYHIFVEDWSVCSHEEKKRRTNEFVIGELLNNPLFSIADYKRQINEEEELYKRIEYLRKQQMLKQQSKNLEKMRRENISVSCPYCKSTNTSKITTTSKAIHTMAFGIYSVNRNSKEWHCNNCKSDF